MKYFLITKVGNYFEDVGFLVDKGYLRRELVKDLLGDSAKYYYKLFENYIMGKRQADPDLYERFERLAKNEGVN